MYWKGLKASNKEGQELVISVPKMIKSDPILCPIRVEEFSYTELTIYDKEGTPKTSANNFPTSMYIDIHWTEARPSE